MRTGRPKIEESDKKAHSVRVRLDEEMFCKLKNYARTNRKTVADTVREAIKEKIK